MSKSNKKTHQKQHNKVAVDRNKKINSDKPVSSSTHKHEEIPKLNNRVNRITIQSSDDDDELPDFDYLLKFKASVDSHLILKSDQKLFDASELGNHFQIDKELLNLCMLSIPFNERHNLNDLCWRSDELHKMQESAKNYEIRLSQNRSEMKTRKSSEKFPESFSSQTNPSSFMAKLDKPVTSGAKTEKEEIQNWLDDVLDL